MTIGKDQGAYLPFKRLVVLVAMIISACGSSSDDGKVTIAGTVGGLAFEAKSGAFDTVGESSIDLAIADLGGICDIAKSGLNPTNIGGKSAL